MGEESIYRGRRLCDNTLHAVHMYALLLSLTATCSSSTIVQEARKKEGMPPSYYCSTFQVGCLREIGSNGEIGIRSIDAKITQTTNPIVYVTKTVGLGLMLF